MIRCCRRELGVNVVLCLLDHPTASIPPPLLGLCRSVIFHHQHPQAFELSFFKGVSRTSSLFSVGMDAGEQQQQ